MSARFSRLHNEDPGWDHLDKGIKGAEGKSKLRPKPWSSSGKLNKQDLEAIQKDWEENVVPLLHKELRDLRRILGR
jgi:hypothetical protein